MHMISRCNCTFHPSLRSILTETGPGYSSALGRGSIPEALRWIDATGVTVPRNTGFVLHGVCLIYLAARTLAGVCVLLNAIVVFIWSPVIWATNHLGDRQVGDKPTGRQPTGRHILVNWATEVETTGPQLWKCERLTIAVLGQLCAVLGQRPFNITYQLRNVCDKRL